MIVGVFAGAKPTSGYRVEIMNVQMMQDKVVVDYRETSPPAGMAAAAILTQPYDLRVIPRTSLPITFQREL